MLLKMFLRKLFENRWLASLTEHVCWFNQVGQAATSGRGAVYIVGLGHSEGFWPSAAGQCGRSTTHLNR